MTTQAARPERRKSPRLRFDDVIRWKRPGRAEDHKAWSIDRSDEGIGFCTVAQNAPRVGEIINLRVFNRDRWMTFDGPVKVARVDATPGGELVMVGCMIESPAQPTFRNRETTVQTQPIG